MSRLYDDIISGRVSACAPKWISGYPESDRGSRYRVVDWKERFGSHVVFDITNIAHYIWCDTPQERFMLERDFPRPVPQFSRMWMEYKRPPFILSEEFVRVDLNDSFPLRIGVEVSCMLMSNPNVMEFTMSQMGVRYEQVTQDFTLASKSFKVTPVTSSQTVKRLKEEVSRSKWLVRMEFWAEKEESHAVVGPMEELFFWLDNEGVVVDSVYQWPFITSSGYKPDVKNMKHMDAFFYPALMALSFMNCKRVRAIDNKPPVKLVKASIRRRGVAPVTYKTLVIDHLKEVASRKDASDHETGIRRAMHICRGHFAEYGGPKGKLFGKLEGLFWIPQHVRGSQDEGIVLKDYEVK